MIAAPLIAFALSLPPCYAERQDPQRPAHVTLIAEAVAAASDTPEDAAGLFTIGYHESSLCWSVATGAKHGGDGWGPWQLEPGSRRQKPFIGEDLPALSHAAGEALWLWHHSRQCGSGLPARFTAYAGLRCGTKWSGASRRARFYSFAVMDLASRLKGA
jgi:hypothetical protein